MAEGFIEPGEPKRPLALDPPWNQGLRPFGGAQVFERHFAPFLVILLVDVHLP
jgi:hypothetical protein